MFDVPKYGDALNDWFKDCLGGLFDKFRLERDMDIEMRRANGLPKDAYVPVGGSTKDYKTNLVESLASLRKAYEELMALIGDK